ncbi:MAG: 2-hydroxyacyl-CoA dehydratase [Eubacteriaceae bacterium]|nr:2-hydroxyacyl-CoA dehydratase [Eubacteriaceae bacterium]
MTKVNELLEQFHKVAVSPEEQLKSYLSQGRKVVACVPVYTPEELIHSMNLVPFGAWGAEIEVREAKKYFPAFICSILQTTLEMGITGKYDGISAIVIPSLCDSLKCLGENWKYGVPNIPFIPMTYPQNRNNDNGRAFTKAGYLRVIDDLEKITGKKFSEAELAKSNKVYNLHNQAMRRLSDVLVEYPWISASQRNDIFKSAYYMTKEEHTTLVNQLMDLLLEMPKETSNMKKIITTGIIADSRDLLTIIGENDMQIVGDDIAHESRQYRTDVNESKDALEGLADKFSRMDNCSVLYDVDKKRGDYIAEMAKRTGADGVVVVMTKFCDPEEFDYPIMKKKFDAAGIPSVLIEVDMQMNNYEQARTALQTFKDMLN